MKIKRILGVALVAVTAITGLVFSGCGDKNDDNGGNKTYTLEAEYIDLSEVAGAGESSSQAGVQMIYGDGDQEDKDKGWSEGYFVGYTYVADLQLDFNFTSDKETTATIILRLGSELGSLNLTNSIFEVKLNGQTVPYASLSVPGGTVLEEIQFHDLKLKDNAKIKAGENTISLIVKDNKLVANERVGGPCVDCIKLTTDAVITWNPKTDNPSLRGGAGDLE